jgi:hypothetical protein
LKTERLVNGTVRIDTVCYMLEIRPRDALAYLEIKGTHQKHLFFPGGACNPVGKRDETRGFGLVSVTVNRGITQLTFTEQSTLWKGKKHTWLCGEKSIEVFYDLQGKGDIERAHFFRGYLDGEERGMGSEMDEVLSTCPNFQEKLFFHPGESFTLSAGNHLEMPVVCISTFTLNPLLAEYTDMVRIADMYTPRLTAHETMLHRAALYRIAQPQAVIDTDGQLAFHTLDDYSSELVEQAKIGVPSLYAAELVIRGRFFLPTRVTKITKEDYRVFAKVFAQYRKNL